MVTIHYAYVSTHIQILVSIMFRFLPILDTPFFAKQPEDRRGGGEVVLVRFNDNRMGLQFTWLKSSRISHRLSKITTDGNMSIVTCRLIPTYCLAGTAHDSDSG